MNDILLRELAKEKKKIFLSCGGAKIPEIFHAVEILKKNKLKPILMHGFQNYPTKIEDTNLNQIKLLQNCFGEILIYLRSNNRPAPHPSMCTQTAHPGSKFRVPAKNGPKWSKMTHPNLHLLGPQSAISG